MSLRLHACAVHPDRPLTTELKEKVVIQLVSNRKIITTKGIWSNEWMESKFKDLGSVRLLIDTIPPSINAAWKNGANLSKAKTLSILAKDNMGNIKNFKALLDGQWLLFSRKGNYFIHKFDDRTATGPHQLKVIVEDIAGNVIEKSYSFIR